MLAEVRFYRHGETEWNQCGRLQGWLDSALTEQGKLAAIDVQWEPDIVFCSDLNRALQTAKLMFPDCTIRQSAALREIYLGDWQGKYIKDLQHDQDYLCYMQSPEKFQAKTQESFQQVTERMLQFYDELKHLPYKKIAVISHGVAIACLTAQLQKKSLVQLWDYMLAGCSYVSFFNEKSP